MFSVLILLNDADDKFLTDQVMNELKLDVKPHFVFQSDELFNFTQNNIKPHLILLDYNTAPENGLLVLKRLKASSETTAIPVLVLNDSSQQKYTKDCYLAGANTVIKKPDTYEATSIKIKTCFSYWVDVAER